MTESKVDEVCVSLELDRLCLVIESAVRNSDPVNYKDVLSLLTANRAALAASKRHRESEEQLGADDGQCTACEGDMCTAKPGCVTCSYQPYQHLPKQVVDELIAAGDFLAMNGTDGMVGRWERAKAALEEVQ